LRGYLKSFPQIAALVTYAKLRRFNVTLDDLLQSRAK
jgi:hypothetical protein